MLITIRKRTMLLGRWMGVREVGERWEDGREGGGWLELPSSSQRAVAGTAPTYPPSYHLHIAHYSSDCFTLPSSIQISNQHVVAMCEKHDGVLVVEQLRVLGSGEWQEQLNMLPSHTTQCRLSMYNIYIFVQYAPKSLLPLVRLSMHRVCTICKVVLLLPSCNQATKVFMQTERLLFFGPT